MKIMSIFVFCFITFCSFSQSSKTHKRKLKKSKIYQKTDEKVIKDSLWIEQSAFSKLNDTIGKIPTLKIPSIKVATDLTLYSKKSKGKEKKKRASSLLLDMQQQQQVNWHQQQMNNHNNQVQQIQQNMMRTP